MKREPGVRKDGKCYVCKGTRPEAAKTEGDAFCSTECCKRYNGLLPKTTKADGRRKEGTRKATETRKRNNPGANFEIRGKKSARVKS